MIRGVILVVAALIIVGVVLIGYSLNQTLGYNFIAWGGDIFLVYGIIDVLLLRDERNRWRTVKSRVLALVRTNLTDTLDDVNLVTKAAFVTTHFPPQATREQQIEAMRQAILEKMRRLATDSTYLSTEVDPALMSGSLNAFFVEKAKRLSDLEVKYWSKFLEPTQMALIIDLESCLDSLNTHITIASKYLQVENPSEGSQQTRRYYEGFVYEDLGQLLQLLSNGVENDMIDIPVNIPFPPGTPRPRRP